MKCPTERNPENIKPVTMGPQGIVTRLLYTAGTQRMTAATLAHLAHTHQVHDPPSYRISVRRGRYPENHP
jgi:hypothetical protein